MTTFADDLVFWIANNEDGNGAMEIRAGIHDDHDPRPWTLILTPTGWRRVPGASDPPIPSEVADEAIGELCWRAANAGLHGDGLSAPGPWRLSMTLRAIMPR